MRKKIYFFIGTTAELLKLFPVIRELERRDVDFKIITSGQTRVNFEETSNWIKKTKADIALPPKKNQSSIIFFIMWIIKTFFKAPILLFREFKNIDRPNSFFIIHGDTVSSLIGAILARFYNLKIIHIESGLRSFNFWEPFPEEITRVAISKFADVHFCPNEWSLNNLRNTPGEKIDTFKNTFFESYLAASKKDAKLKIGKVVKGKYFVFVLHRQEHIIFKKRENLKMVRFVVDNVPSNINCVFIKHATTSKFLKSVNQDFLKRNKKRMIFLPRLPYSSFVGLLKNAEFLVTDGGGNQEEAYYMGLPCLLLRNYTERPEGLGENVVLGKNNFKIITPFLRNYGNFKRKAVFMKVRPSKIIVDYLLGS